MNIGEEQKVAAEAYRYIVDHQREIIERFANPVLYKAVEKPVSLFMAGSPGAGKTEVSNSLVKKFSTAPIRIDADEIRKICPQYSGSYAHIFQKAATKGVHILFDYALKNQIHAIIDGTFAYADALKNIERSMDHGRIAELWFVYQDPLQAWKYTKIREAIETRKVEKNMFIRSFLRSKENAISAKNRFGGTLELNLLVKNIDNSDGQLRLNIQADELDHYIGRSYTEAELVSLLL